MQKRIVIIGLVGVGLLGVWGCKSASRNPSERPTAARSNQSAPRSNQNVDPNESLRARAEALWNAKVAEDWGRVFEFEDPNARQEWNKDEFVAWSKENEPFKIQSFELGKVQADGEMGWVEVNYNTLIRRFESLPARDAKLWQKWRNVDGTWHPVPLRELVSYPEPPMRRNAREEARLRARFMQSWEARKAGDHHALYQFIDPLDQPRMPEEAFVDMHQLLEYRTCKVNWVEAVGDLGRVHVTYTRKVTDPSLSKLPVETVSEIEEWIKTNGEWYRDLVRGSVATPGDSNDAS